MILTVTDDLDLTRIAQSGQCFRWECLPEGAFRILSASRCLCIKPLSPGEFELSCTAAEFDLFWHRYFDLDENYAAIRSRICADQDPFLHRAAQSEKGIRILRQPPFEALISFIISQNKNIPAICRSIQLLCEKAGDEKYDSRGLPYRAFPAPEALAALSEEDLKACGLGYRCRYVHEAASLVSSGLLDLAGLENAGPEESIQALMRLPGVGLKVASCVSLFGLHHLNTFPQDVWIRRVLENEYPLGYPFDKYAPYNGVYQQYMFAFYRNAALREGRVI